ncbi:MAG: PrsW family intramembrane metalloprotease, partial [Anaerolineae bacterium]|nr:PrsW family intramembrane metalloprotease [Anaerolineae bacterium]
FGPGLSAPLIEEALKGILVLLLFLGLRREFDGPLDGIVYGALVGLGFAVSENAAYMIEEGFRQHFLTRILLRGLAGHATYTALTGLGLGIARAVQKRSQVPGTATAGTSQHRTAVALGPIVGFVLAVAAHMIWNRLSGIFATGWWGFIRGIVVLNLPFVAVVGLGLWLSLQQEDEVVLQYLPADMYDEVSYTSRPDFATARARYQARRRAARTIGRPKARLVHNLQRTLIEIAFWLRYAAREKLDASTIPELARLRNAVAELRGKITEASQMGQ